MTLSDEIAVSHVVVGHVNRYYFLLNNYFLFIFLGKLFLFFFTELICTRNVASNIESAPKDFELYGKKNLDDSEVLVLLKIYDLNDL